MANQGDRRAEGTAAPQFILDRREAVPALIGRHEDFLIVSGLAGTSRDVAALTRDGAHTYTMAGAMGGACMIGLGLALARPERRVLVVTGDGELLMNVGALATIAVMNPANLAIVCVDNGHYGETGYQKSHTSLGVDLEKIAAGRGSGQRARSLPEKNSPMVPVCCARATAPSLSRCASSRPTHRPSSAIWIPPPAAAAFAPRSWAPPNIRGRAPSSRAPLPPRGLLRHPRPAHGAAFRPPAAAMRRPRPGLPLAT